jgi:hypothetical protein
MAYFLRSSYQPEFKQEKGQFGNTGHCPWVEMNRERVLKDGAYRTSEWGFR